MFSLKSDNLQKLPLERFVSSVQLDNSARLEHARLVRRLETHMAEKGVSQVRVAAAASTRRIITSGTISLWLGRTKGAQLSAATLAEVDAQIATYLADATGGDEAASAAASPTEAPPPPAASGHASGASGACASAPSSAVVAVPPRRLARSSSSAGSSATSGTSGTGTSNAAGKRPRHNPVAPPAGCFPPPQPASKYSEGCRQQSADGSTWAVEVFISGIHSWKQKWVYVDAPRVEPGTLALSLCMPSTPAQLTVAVPHPAAAAGLCRVLLRLQVGCGVSGAAAVVSAHLAIAHVASAQDAPPVGSSAACRHCGRVIGPAGRIGGGGGANLQRHERACLGPAEPGRPPPRSTGSKRSHQAATSAATTAPTSAERHERLVPPEHARLVQVTPTPTLTLTLALAPIRCG